MAQWGFSVFDNYIIEIDGNAAGILVRADRHFAFHALEPAFAALEGVVFADAVAAERAARQARRQARPAARLEAAL